MWLQFLYLCGLLINFGFSLNQHAPKIVDDEDVPLMKLGAHIDSTDAFVELKPRLRATDLDSKDSNDGKICGYDLTPWNDDPTNAHHDDVTLFTVSSIINRQHGVAHLIVRPGITLTRKVYKLRVAARDCGIPALVSKTLPLTIRVNRISTTDSPKLVAEVESADEQTIEIQEGFMYEKIVSVGEDCLCSLLVTGDEKIPFSVEKNCLLRNTEPLRSSEHHLALLVASCAAGSKSMRRLNVRVVVTPKCEPKWLDIGTTVPAGDDDVALAASARLETCGLCEGDGVEMNVRAKALDCDDERKCTESGRRVIDLMASASAPVPSWSAQLADGRGADTIFSFDGRTATKVAPILGHDLAREPVTVWFWMRHATAADDSKEQIVCSSDTDGMNRHHYSLFVHNCHIVLLVRQEPAGVFGSDATVTKPAEFRFSLGEACDGLWHHYAVNINVTGDTWLIVDGRPVAAVDVLDDFALHASPRVSAGATLTVGACWHGKSGEMVQHFRGDLSDLSVVVSSEACTTQCSAQLAVDTDTQPDERVETTSDGVTIHARSARRLELLLRHLVYRGGQGGGRITLQTELRCTKSVELPVPAVTVRIDQNPEERVATPRHRVVVIDGKAEVSLTDADLMMGAEPLADLRLRVTDKAEVVSPGDALRSALLRGKALGDADVQQALAAEAASVDGYAGAGDAPSVSTVPDEIATGFVDSKAETVLYSVPQVKVEARTNDDDYDLDDDIENEPNDDCLLPKETGPCRAAMPAWHYSAVEGRCVRFTYGGCKGNANRFDSAESCKTACAGTARLMASLVGAGDVAQCSIRFAPPIDPTLEQIAYDRDLAHTVGVTVTADDEHTQLVFTGAASAIKYVALLRQVRYTHTAPQGRFTDRTWTVRCRGDEDGATEQTAFVVTLRRDAPVEVNEEKPIVVVGLKGGAKLSEAKEDYEAKLKASDKPRRKLVARAMPLVDVEFPGAWPDAARSKIRSVASPNSDKTQQALAPGYIVLIVACSLLFVLVVTSVVVRALRTKPDAADKEMEWDEGDLHVVVNPMDPDSAIARGRISGELPLVAGVDDVPYDEDSDFEFNQDVELKPHGGENLEWDDEPVDA